ncbi:ABC transporter ATP-binding protein [uncultured Dokdonia sp.]|uniref:ABC transporter ATP-binding protein n=1 Tax=uncultured Dokdonia sp. TaxID=575653 RepID=UPI00262E94D6|nr:ABC transporter ATP-binding protein [uncultured Dokdonia sp.]
MSDIILKAENISKQYRLGLVGLGTLAHDFNRFWHKIRGKEDPYLKIGSVNDRSAKASSEYVWALQDISFEVNKGEVLGIVGKNGAGKSTLLKILSRVTAPTEGNIKTAGRIASLLEVGTGMHPELTGRENIFLNGAILGMTKAEIRSKIDEIIEFSGCEMYIDTPVKRYSSGMRVRLGFAVAAFLEPDILVVDEVLAVGDAEFQKKAIGKMQDISSEGGRTVLFVSHNMAAVRDLCTRVIILENGGLTFDGETNEGVNRYLSEDKVSTGREKFEENEEKFKAQFKKFEILNLKKELTSKYHSGEKMCFRIFIDIKTKIRNPIFSLRLSDFNNVNVITWRSNDYIEEPLPKNCDQSLIVDIKTRDLFLLNGIYTLSMSFLDGKELLDFHEKFINFEILPDKPSEDFYSITKAKTSNSILFSIGDWAVDFDS